MHAEQDAVLGALGELGLSHAQKLRFSYAVQHSTPEQLTAEDVEARYRSRFGDQYESTLDRLERVWSALSLRRASRWRLAEALGNWWTRCSGSR